MFIMKNFLLILFAPILCFGQAKLDDTDKHFIAGTLISTATTFTLKAFKVKHAPAWGFVVASLAGMGKELIDHAGHGMRFKDESNAVYYDHIGDAFYTADGGMCATIVLFIVLKKRNKKDDYMPAVE